MNPTPPAPVALFIYRRPEHVRRTLQTLAACPEWKDSPIHIYCDGPKTPEALSSVGEARRVARELAPASAVLIEREQNLGLAKSIIQGVTDLTDRFGKVIVVEDDLEVAPSFLSFMNRALDHYASDEAVMQVSGYQFPLNPPLGDDPRFLSFPTSWGWGTWARAWKHFDPNSEGYTALANDAGLRRRFDLDGSYPYFKMLKMQRQGKVDSWAIRWHLSVFMRNGLALYPGRSLVRNGGFDGSGTHCAPGTGFADDPGAADSKAAEWSMPRVALDVESQRLVFAHLAAHSRIDWRARLANAKMILPKKVMSKARTISHSLLGTGRSLLARASGAPEASHQDLLEARGIGNVWNEIELLLANLRGSVVDIACGTGKVMTILQAYPALELHGFDISQFLIQKAIDSGISKDRLAVADATKTHYPDNAFDFGYSIGSLEHFTEEGILKFVAETHRITRRASFHRIPTSRSGKNEGWMKALPGFHNNSVDWWVERYRSAYSEVRVLDSAWNDRISVGKWFLCVKEGA